MDLGQSLLEQDPWVILQNFSLSGIPQTLKEILQSGYLTLWQILLYVAIISGMVAAIIAASSPDGGKRSEQKNKIKNILITVVMGSLLISFCNLIIEITKALAGGV